MLRLHNVWKSFGGTTALAGAGITLRPSEVHALVGANGAGKSTLARIMAGLVQPDSGVIELEGRIIRHSSAREAIRSGIAMVTQETSVAPDLSVLENIMLPRFGLPGRLNWRLMRREAEELISGLGQITGLDVDAIVHDLSIGQRQLVEMLRALALKGRIILFDEPTASLSPSESEQLFEIMRKLTSTGHALVLVTHRLEEIFAVCDRVTVLREGRVVADGLAVQGLDQQKLIRLMVGRELSKIYGSGSAPGRHSTSGAAVESIVLSVKHLHAPPYVKDVSFNVSAGEILGLAGLIGSGRSELLETIFGLRQRQRGDVIFNGSPLGRMSPTKAIRSGIGLIPEDRRRQSIVPDFSVRENLLLAHLAARTSCLLGYGERQAQVELLFDHLGLPAARIYEKSLLNFSGGMQQKIVLGRSLILAPRLLLLDEPTRGVDISTRATIYSLIRSLSAEGVACVVVSSDFEEVIGLTDRVVVLSDGRDVTTIPSYMLDPERLAMFAAPRSSADLTHRVLEYLVQSHGGVAFWGSLDRDRLYCFDNVGSETNAYPGFRVGEFPEICRTRIPCALQKRSAEFIEDDGGSLFTMMVPIVGRKGHNLGYVGLCLPHQPERDLALEISNAVQEQVRISHLVSPNAIAH